MKNTDEDTLAESHKHNERHSKSQITTKSNTKYYSLQYTATDSSSHQILEKYNYCTPIDNCRVISIYYRPSVIHDSYHIVNVPYHFNSHRGP